MDICLERVTQEQREILARLLELYQYDFSEYDGGDVNPYGLYGYAYLDYYWTEREDTRTSSKWTESWQDL